MLIFGNFSTTQAQEDVELRRAVRRRTANLQERLQNDQLDSDGSLWWSRRSLEARLVFFLSDIVLDMICCINFFRAEAYAFGGCQLVILTFSGILQLKVGFGSTWKAIQNSLRKGLPNNVVHLLLLQEKTFEAPLSLCFQFYAAFYVNENLAAFVSLWVSMFFSIVGIANGIYIYNHLTPFDLDLLEEEEATFHNWCVFTESRNPSTSCFTTATRARVYASPRDGAPKTDPTTTTWVGLHTIKSEGRKETWTIRFRHWMKTRSFWTVLISCHHVIMSPSHLFTICKDRCGSLRWAKRAPFALFFFPWWKVKILGAAKYSGDFFFW